MRQNLDRKIFLSSHHRRPNYELAFTSRLKCRAASGSDSLHSELSQHAAAEDFAECEEADSQNTAEAQLFFKKPNGAELVVDGRLLQQSQAKLQDSYCSKMLSSKEDIQDGRRTLWLDICNDSQKQALITCIDDLINLKLLYGPLIDWLAVHNCSMRVHFRRVPDFHHCIRGPMTHFWMQMGFQMVGPRKV